MKAAALILFFAMAGHAAFGSVFGDIFYGTQYYRAPTPLPDEWETDLGALGDLHLDLIQIRINWRNNERCEDVYTFDDVDRLMDLAEKYGKKVVIKFLLECAPQYVFDKYDGSRIGHKGEKLRGSSNGAFYSGGWLPCFTNPKVAERAAKFVRIVAERYADRRNLVFWNAWNEPRCRPVDECFCTSCRKAFGEYLRHKFGTVEKLNDFYGVCEESFERIALPISANGYWDVFEFKKFKSANCIHDNLKFVYEAVRTVDKCRPVISHIGATAGFQYDLNDICDDFTVSKAVDGWGTSLPLDTTMDTPEKRLAFGRLNDFLRCVDPNYFIYEIYPGLGMFHLPYDTVWDMDYKLYSGLACGSKGFSFWQYRAERVAGENDCAGLARADGSPRSVLESVRRFGADLQPLKKVLAKCQPPRAEIAIVFDYDSLLMSEIEDAAGPLYDFKPIDERSIQYYTRSHSGFYELMRRNDYPVDYVPVRKAEEILHYKVAYFPDCAMLDPAIVPVLEKFVANGGILLADEGFGLRQLNTWMNPYDIACGKIMKARLRERRQGGRKVSVRSATAESAGYHSEYAVENAEVVCSFADGVPAVQMVRFGKGKTLLFGFSIGYASAVASSPLWLGLFEDVTQDAGLSKTSYGRFAEGLEERRLVGAGGEYVFLINSSDREKSVEIREKVAETFAAGRMNGGAALVPARACMIFRCERKDKKEDNQ